MLTLLDDIVTLLASFAPLFSRRVWRYVPVLVVGALLAPGRRMVSTAWRALRLGQVRHFQNYHRVLSRAVWSSLRASRILLLLQRHTTNGCPRFSTLPHPHPPRPEFSRPGRDVCGGD